MLYNALQPFRPYLTRPGVVEIRANEPGKIWLEIPGTGSFSEDVPGITLEVYKALARAIAHGKNVVDFWNKPYLATSMPGGHRLQLCLGQSVETGVAMSIRMFTPRRYTLDDYQIPTAWRAEMLAALLAKKNIVISGGTFSGKTQFANACLASIPEKDRIISVQDTVELDLLRFKDKVSFIVDRLVTQEAVNYQTVIDAVTRLRPDRVIVGELNMENTWIMLRLLNTGHGGLLTTVHANDPELAFDAITENVLLTKDIDHAVLDRAFRRRIDMIVQIERVPDTYIRRVCAIFNKEVSPDVRTVD